MKEVNLPSWAKRIAKDRVEINMDEALPELLEELGLEEDKFGVAVARQCAIKDVQIAIAGTELKPKQGGGHFILLSGDKERLAFKNLPNCKRKGKDKKPLGLDEANKPAVMNEHYARIRGLDL